MTTLSALSFIRAALQLMRVERPVGTVLLACPMLWALWLSADGQPQSQHILIFLIGAFLMRSAGCVINDFADRDIDRHVKRTQDRPLTAGRISAKQSLIVFAFLTLCALSLLVFLPLRVAPMAVVAFILASVYPFTKRFFIIPQLILGLAFSTAILMAYRLHSEEIPLSGWLLFVASTLWTVVYDTFYAMVDRDDDTKLGIHSSALWFAQRDWLICLLLTVVFVGLMLVIGMREMLGGYYYLGLLFAVFCFFYQFIVSKNRQRETCFVAFLNNQWVGVFIFLGILLDSLSSLQ